MDDKIIHVHYIFDIGEALPYVVTIAHAKTIPNGKSLDTRIIEVAKFAFASELMLNLITITYVLDGEFISINL